MDIKKQREELRGLIALYGLFTIALILVDIFYSAWNQMPIWGVGLAIVAHVGVFGSLTLILKEWENPKYDLLRKLYFLFFLLALGLVGGYRVAKNEGTMFEQDIDKAKQESTRLNEFGEKTDDDSILALRNKDTIK